MYYGKGLNPGFSRTSPNPRDGLVIHAIAIPRIHVLDVSLAQFKYGSPISGIGSAIIFNHIVTLGTLRTGAIDGLICMNE